MKRGRLKEIIEELEDKRNLPKGSIVERNIRNRSDRNQVHVLQSIYMGYSVYFQKKVSTP